LENKFRNDGVQEEICVALQSLKIKQIIILFQPKICMERKMKTKERTGR